MPKWEYKVVDATFGVRMERFKAYRTGMKWIKPRVDSIQELLNQLGKEGWELVSVHISMFDDKEHIITYFKRQVA